MRELVVYEVRRFVRCGLIMAAVVQAAPSMASGSPGVDVSSARHAAHHHHVSQPAVRSTVRLRGVVLGADGAPAADAVVFGDDGHKAVSDSSGAFELESIRPAQGAELELTAIATIDGATSTGRRQFRPSNLDSTDDVGVITLEATGSCAPEWISKFGPKPGVDGMVRAIVVFDDGDGDGPSLFVCGDFNSAGGLPVHKIAKWNGTRWSALGSGLEGTAITPSAHAMTVFDDGSGPALVVGGSFTKAGGMTANRIAKWNGSTWSAMGSITSEVDALAVFDDGSGPSLYAGGKMGPAGGPTGLVRWTGSAWTMVGTGLNGFVRSLIVFDDGSGGGPALHAGGTFTIAGGVLTPRVARWDGRTWSGFGTGFNGDVGALCAFDDESGEGPQLFAGGEFTKAGTVTVNHVAKWTGSEWTALDGGVNGSVRALASFDDGSGPSLYIGGFFTTANGKPSESLAVWNGTTLAPAPVPIYGIETFAVIEDGCFGESALCAGGQVSTSNGATLNHIATWDGLKWRPIGKGFQAPVWSLITIPHCHDDESTLYAGGSLTSSNGVQVSGVAEWDGATWQPLDGGTSGTDPQVRAMAGIDDCEDGETLFVGGAFTQVGGMAVNRIAKWHDHEWSPLGSGVTGGNVLALAMFDDGLGGGPALFAGGSFTKAGGITVNRIARWDGTAWSSLDGGMSSGVVAALTVFDDGGGPALYAGGSFMDAGGVPAVRIARWNGRAWSAVGPGFDGIVQALAVREADESGAAALFAGGNFTHTGVAEAARVAQWTGTEWTALGGGVSGLVRALTLFDDGAGIGPSLYAGGDFLTAEVREANRVARWNGSEWQPLEDGVNSSVYALAVHRDSADEQAALIVGGWFDESPAGDSFVAAWRSCPVICAPPDLDCDGLVGGSDLCLILSAWGPCGDCDADLDGNGLVDGVDLALILGAWTH